MKKNLTLVVLAAGIGSRYGGLKQLESFGPSGEILLDYSFYDAIKAGFDKIVCVIRRDIQEIFYEKITRKWENYVNIVHVYQEMDDLPGDYNGQHRQKPWGTTHAILAARDVVKEPFTVINADDFYGSSTYSTIADFLSQTPQQQALVGFIIRNTLSPHGTVSRGICEVTPQGFLENVVERTKIKLLDGAIVYEDNGQWQEISKETTVSMNFWGFTPEIFPLLQQEFAQFLQQHSQSPGQECYIPTTVDNLIKSGQISVHVLKSKEKWMGVTYVEDKQHVKKTILDLIDEGRYPSSLLSVMG